MSRKYKARLNKEPTIIKANLDTKTEERDKAENMKLKRKELVAYKSVEINAKSHNIRLSKYIYLSIIYNLKY